MLKPCCVRIYRLFQTNLSHKQDSSQFGHIDFKVTQETNKRKPKKTCKLKNGRREETCHALCSLFLAEFSKAVLDS